MKLKYNVGEIVYVIKGDNIPELGFIVSIENLNSYCINIKDTIEHNIPEQHIYRIIDKFFEQATIYVAKHFIGEKVYYRASKKNTIISGIIVGINQYLDKNKNYICEYDIDSEEGISEERVL